MRDPVSPPLAAPSAPVRSVPTGARMAFGAGAVALGIKENGFSVFLLIFYNQVIGLPASLAGAAILMALAVDALLDPLIGVLSDRTRTRWGRRHPWLYGAALPIAIAWIMLWNPPTTGEAGTLAWLLLSAILVRAALSCTEVPSIALLPEMTRDYHERTAVLRYRFLFGWLGGGTMLLLAYGLFFKGAPDPNLVAGTAQAANAASAPATQAAAGFLDRDGYYGFALTGAVLMSISILVCALGTHRLYARPLAEAVPHAGPRETLRMIRETILTNRAYVILLCGGMFSFAIQAVSFALSNYMLTYVWQFSKSGVLAYGVSLFVAALVAFAFIGPISRRLGKRGAAVTFAAASALFGTAPYLLRLIGLFPEPHNPALLPLFLGFALCAITSGIGMIMAAGSMLADVTEATQLRTGRREEGVLSAVWFLMQKCATGLGIFVSGLIVSIAGLPKGAQPGTVAAPILNWLTSLSCLTVIVLAAGAVWFFRRFPLDQEQYEESLRQLAVASALDDPR